MLHRAEAVQSIAEEPLCGPLVLGAEGLEELITPLRAVLPGVLLTLGLWLMGASLFSLYLGTVADYSGVYGSLGGVVITLFFFYLTGALFILGAEYNAVRLKATAGLGATTGETGP